MIYLLTENLSLGILVSMDMTQTFGREFNEARQKQGFKSQAQLDAFYAAYDHNKSCADCRKLDGHALLDDGYQPTVGSCATHKKLERIYFSL